MAAISDFDFAAARRSFEEARLRGITLRRRTADLCLHATELRWASAEALRDAFLACSAARTICTPLLLVPSDEPPRPPNTAPLARAACPLDGVDIEELVDDLIDAYQAAAITGHEESHGFLRDALTVVGRHLAGRVGPRAAGVRLN